jgi:hypothetical protein
VFDGHFNCRAACGFTGTSSPIMFGRSPVHRTAHLGVVLPYGVQWVERDSLSAAAAAAAAGADKWVFPAPILDEPAYRRAVRQAEGTA